MVHIRDVFRSLNEAKHKKILFFLNFVINFVNINPVN